MIKGAKALGYVNTVTESILSGNGTCGKPCRKKPRYCDVAEKVPPYDTKGKGVCCGL